MPDKSYGGGSYNSGYGSKSGSSSSRKSGNTSTYYKGTNWSSGDKISQQKSTKYSSRPDAGAKFSWSKGGGTVSGPFKTSLPSSLGRNGGGVRLLSASDSGRGGLTVAYKGTNLSSADRAKGGNGLSSFFGLRQAMESARPTLSDIISGRKPSLYRDMADRPSELGDYVTSPGATAALERTAIGGVNRAATKSKPYMASLGDDMASDIERRVAERVSQPGPLKGGSWQGRSAAVSPMAGQGAISAEMASRLGALPFTRQPSLAQAISPQGGMFGPDLPVYRQANDAGRESRRENRRALGLAGLPPPQFDLAYNPDTLGPDYETGNLGPQSGPETMPDPAGAPPPTQKYNVADSFRYDVNPSQERQPVPGFISGLPGVLGGIGRGLNWMSNLPGDGPTNQFATGVDNMRPGMMLSGRSTDPELDAREEALRKQQEQAGLPVNKPGTTPVVNPFVPPQFSYPTYSQTWAGLPMGKYRYGA